MKKGVSEHKVLPRWTSQMTEVLSGLLDSLGTQEAGRGVGGAAWRGWRGSVPLGRGTAHRGRCTGQESYHVD